MPGEYITSEAVFQHHEHISGAVALGGDPAEVGVQLVAGNAGVDNADEGGQIELGAFGQVVHLGSELQVMALGDMHVLDDGEVPVVLAGGPKGVAAEASHKPAAWKPRL